MAHRRAATQQDLPMLFAKLSHERRCACTLLLTTVLGHRVWPYPMRWALGVGLLGFAYLLLATVAPSSGRSTPSFAGHDRAVLAVVQQDTGTLSLRVVDAESRPLAEADVFVVQLNASYRTDNNGQLRIGNVPLGVYDVGIRKVGFLPAATKVTVGEGGEVQAVALVAFTTRLTPMVTVASRVGLSGVVADTALRPLAKSRVNVRGSGRSVTTDSAGRFFIPLRPGSYMVQVTYAHEMVAVSIPKDSGREIAVWLRPMTKEKKAQQIVEEVRLFELDRRMLRASGTMTRYFTRAQLEALGITEMIQLARRWASRSIEAECQVSIEEGARPYRVPITSVFTDEVDFVEMYLPTIGLQSKPRGNTSLSGRPTTIMTAGSAVNAASPSCGNVGLMVWPRR
jgi:hypothetical protein